MANLLAALAGLFARKEPAATGAPALVAPALPAPAPAPAPVGTTAPIVVSATTVPSRKPVPGEPGWPSPHFTVYDTWHSDTADQHHQDNNWQHQPDAAVYPPRLEELFSWMEWARAELGGHPITITSCYRDLEVNQEVGGVSQSAHRFGYACDWVCPGFGTPLQCALKLKEGIDAGRAPAFDQVIMEQSWLHTATGPGKRGQMMTMRNGGYSFGFHA